MHPTRDTTPRRRPARLGWPFWGVVLSAALAAPLSQCECDWKWYPNCDDHGGDSDGDGTCDAWDRCPGFPDWEDRDEDGIPDGCDPCPDVPDDGTDTDGDGRPDACDACPFEFAESDVNADGCPDDATTICFAQPYDDVDQDGVPDRCDPCLPPDCPAPWEVFNGDFEDGMTGWSPMSIVDWAEVDVVDDGSSLVLRMVLGECGSVQASGSTYLPDSFSTELPSLRLRYRVEVEPPAQSASLVVFAGGRRWRIVDPGPGWRQETLCLEPAQLGFRGSVVLRAEWCPECQQCRLEVRVDDVELVWDATECLAPG